MRLYWFLGEPPGKLGRTTTRGVFEIVAAEEGLGDGAGSPTDPLTWALELLPKLDGNIDVGHEKSIIEAVIKKLHEHDQS